MMQSEKLILMALVAFVMASALITLPQDDWIHLKTAIKEALSCTACERIL